MVESEGIDGVRIAQLLSSELTAGAGALADVTVTDADREVEPTADGAYAYAVELRDEHPGSEPVEAPERENAKQRIAEVFVQPDRARVEFIRAPDAAAAAVHETELRVRPAATQPPRVLVFLPDGAAVKRVLPAFAAAVRGPAGSSEPAQ